MNKKRLLTVMGGSLQKYIMYDRFDNDLTTGNVTATLATPGGKRGTTSQNTRTVVDTGGKLSLATGTANFLNNVNWGDPGLWYGAVTRESGLMLVGTIIPADTSNAMMFGWSTGQSSYPAEHALNFDSASLTMAISGSSRCSAGNILVAATRQPVAICLRAKGAFYFVKVSDHWQLYYIDGTKESATLYPAIAGRTRTFSADDIALFRWNPQPLASDSFNRADGAIGTSDGAGHAELNGGASKTWTNVAGTIAVASNKAISSALAVDRAISVVETHTVNVYTQAEVVKNTTGSGVVVRYVDADNYIYAYHDGTNAHLIKHLAAGDASVINTAVTYAANARIEIACSGTSFWLMYNNAQVGTTQTISDATLQTGTKSGIIFLDTDSTIDNFVSWARGTNGEY